MELINFWRIIVRRRWVISISFIAFMCAAVAFLLLFPPTYKAKTKILVDPSTAEISLLSAFKFTIDNSVDIDFDTDVALSQIKGDLDYVIEQLDVRDRWGNQMSAHKIVKSGVLNKFWPQTYIDVEQYEDASILQISAIATNSELAADIANLLAARYIEKRRQLFSDSIKRTRKEVEIELAQIREMYYSDLEEMKDFLIASGNANLDVEVEALIEKIADLKTLKDENDASAAALQKSVAENQAKLSQLDEFWVDSEELTENSYLNALKDRLALSLVELSRIKADYTPLHPEYIGILKEIEELESLMREEVSMITGRKVLQRDPLYQELYVEAHTDRVELQLSLIKKDVYDSLIAGYQAKLLQFPIKQMTSSKIQVRLDSLSEQYGELIQFRNRLEFLENVTILEYQVVEPAKPPKPVYYPKKKLLLAISGFLGIFWALILGILYDYTDRTLRSPKDLVLFEDLDLLGWFPIIGRKELDKVLDERHYSKQLAERYRSIRTKITVGTEGAEVGIITVASCNKGEGKTLLSAHIALSYAMAGKRTLVVDGNFHAPRLHELFGIDPGTVESTGQHGDRPARPVRASGVRNLDIIPGVMHPEDKSADILGMGEMLCEQITSLEHDYDIVVVDTPALRESVDALLYNKSMSCYCILALEVGNTRYDSIDEFCRTIRGPGSTQIGAIVNKVRSCELDEPQKFDDILEMCMQMPIQLVRKAFR